MQHLPAELGSGGVGGWRWRGGNRVWEPRLERPWRRRLNTPIGEQKHVQSNEVTNKRL